MGTTSVDPAALRAAAQRIETAAEIVLDAVEVNLQFDGSAAGRSHSAAGGAVRAAADTVVADARQWALAACELAGTLRVAADRCAADDTNSAMSLR
jgi:hypothetical protein